MCLDILLLICWIDRLQTFHDHIQDWPKYKQLLQDVHDFLATLDSDREYLSTNVLIEDWQLVDKSIGEVKLQLDQVVRLVNWNKRTRSFKFILKYKNATKHGRRLHASIEGLQELRQRMDFLKAKLKIHGTYFREERGRTNRALAEHCMRHLVVKSSSQLKPF